MYDKIIPQLDKDQPSWYIEWAVGDELADYASEIRYNNPNALANLKSHIARRIFHRLLNAALSAGVIAEKE